MGVNSKCDKSNNEIAELAKKAREGDTLSFVELLGHYSGLIYMFAKSFSVADSELEDLCQEGRLALYRATVGYDGESASFSTYASRCVKNSMISWVRKQNADKSGLGANLSLDEPGVLEVSGGECVSDSAVSSQLMFDLLDSNIAGLSELERRVIGLRIAGAKQGEIASHLGKDEKSIENTLFRARAKLKKYLL